MSDLEITKKNLLPCLSLVAGAIDKRQSLAILANILVKIEPERLELVATDLEMEISATVVCQTTINIQKTTIPAKKFIDIIRSLDDDATAFIKAKENIITIKSGRSQFKLAALPADQFPESKQEVPELNLQITRTDLIYLFQSTYFAISQQDVRFFLNSLLFEINGTTITTVATDGHRMAICRVRLEKSFPFEQFLLPRKGVQEMLRLLQTCNDDEYITIQAAKSYFRLISKNFQFTSRLVEAKFPPYNKAIPKNNDKFVLLEKESFKKALSRIIILTNEKFRAIVLHTQPSSLTLIANNQEQEEAIEILEAQVDGDELKIGINANYLLDVLNVIPEEYIRISMSTVDQSILIETLQNEHYQYIIMPMKL